MSPNHQGELYSTYLFMYVCTMYVCMCVCVSLDEHAKVKSCVCRCTLKSKRNFSRDWTICIIGNTNTINCYRDELEN